MCIALPESSSRGGSLVESSSGRTPSSSAIASEPINYLFRHSPARFITIEHDDDVREMFSDEFLLHTPTIASLSPDSRKLRYSKAAESQRTFCPPRFTNARAARDHCTTL